MAIIYGLLQAVAAMTPGPDPAPATVVIPRIVAEEECEGRAEGDEIIVCGKQERDYRLPEQFRDTTPAGDRSPSWSAGIRDEEALAGFSEQSVGPFGYLQHSRQVDCEWRAERQALRGEVPNCSRSNQPLRPRDPD